MTQIARDIIEHRLSVQPGDRVRCDDFQPMDGRPAYYVQGTVTEKRAHSLVVRVDTDTMFPDNPRPEIVTPIETMLDWNSRILVITRQDPAKEGGAA